MTPLTFFKSLADDTRLRCILLIVRHDELCVCELTKALELSQPMVSRHLAELRKQDIVDDERRGRWVYYRIHPDLPGWARDVLSATENESRSMLLAEETRLEKMKRPNPACV